MAQRNPFIRPDTFWRSLVLRANQSVVHLGCGAGFYIIPAARIVGKKGKVVGVDIRPDMLAEVDNKAQEFGLDGIVKTFRANIEDTPGSPVSEHSMDWVLVYNILHQSDPQKVFQEARRIVSVNGHIVVIGWTPAATPLGPPTEKRIPQNEVKQIAIGNDLVVTKEFAPSPYHYGLVMAPAK